MATTDNARRRLLRRFTCLAIAIAAGLPLVGALAPVAPADAPPASRVAMAPATPDHDAADDTGTGRPKPSTGDGPICC